MSESIKPVKKPVKRKAAKKKPQSVAKTKAGKVSVNVKGSESIDIEPIKLLDQEEIQAVSTLPSKTRYSVEDAEKAHAQLLGAITPARLDKIKAIPEYLKAVEHSNKPVTRQLPDKWELETLLDNYFRTEIAPSIPSLCVYLDISKSVFYSVLEGYSSKDIQSTMLKAVDRIEANIVRGMMTGTLQTVGALFYLKNAYGYRDNPERASSGSVSAIQINVNVGQAK